MSMGGCHAGVIAQLSSRLPEHPKTTPPEKQSSPSPRLPFQMTFCSFVQRSWQLVQPVEQREVRLSSATGPRSGCRSRSPLPAWSLWACSPAHLLRSTVPAGCSYSLALLSRFYMPWSGAGGSSRPGGAGCPRGRPRAGPPSPGPTPQHSGVPGLQEGMCYYGMFFSFLRARSEAFEGVRNVRPSFLVPFLVFLPFNQPCCHRTIA